MRLAWLSLVALFLLSACGDPPPPPDEDGAAQCSDGQDNDADGLTDCDDLLGCGDEIACLNLETCDNNRDDNGNGLQDCADPDCVNAPNCAARCGDNIQNQANEQCDNLDLGGQDCLSQGFDLGELACNAQCQLDTSACFNATCGDGVQEGPEECDDGNTTNEDGCSGVCVIERCGEGVLNGGELCDDGNTLAGDGCSDLCAPEPGFSCQGAPSQCAPDIALAAGGSHTCALVAGEVFCWGANNVGQLGYGNTDAIGDDETPAALPPVNVGGPVVQIATGGEHTCALLDTGAVRCWGGNLSGQLGYGNTNAIGDDETPAEAGDLNLGGAAVLISAGEDHTCAQLLNGDVRCWGFGGNGRLGRANNNNVGDDETPGVLAPVNLGGPAQQLAVGGAHSCALLDTGALRCWGLGTDGQLGYGNANTIGDNEFPFQAGNVNAGGEVLRLALGAKHSCAILDTGAVRCWGFGADGQLGYGNANNIGDNETPASAGDLVLGGEAAQLSAGGNHTCAILSTGEVACWGVNGAGQLGYGNTDNLGDNETPASAGPLSLGDTALRVAGGGTHSCALLLSGEIFCWGSGAAGQLGYGNTDNLGDNEAPTTGGAVALP